MSLGGRIRKLFGRHERLIADIWRSIFMSMEDWIQVVRGWAPMPARILELGCGEGYSTIRLAAAYPQASIDAIDIGEHIGRLYEGPVEHVRFRMIYAEELAEECPSTYDLIVVTDVLHHVPLIARESFLAAIRTLLAPGGMLVFKDWHRNFAPIHYVVYAADRWLTGDRISYLTRKEARELMRSVFGDSCISHEQRIRPWSNNYAMKIIANEAG